MTRRLFTVGCRQAASCSSTTSTPRCIASVIGVIDGADERAHLRAFQAAIAGERTSDPLLVGFPTEVDLAYGGVVLVDALAEALRSVASTRTSSIDDPSTTGRRRIGDEAQAAHVTALEEELEEAGDDERADELEELLERAESSPAWLWATDVEVAQRTRGARRERAPIPLYAPPGLPASFDPLEAADDPRSTWPRPSSSPAERSDGGHPRRRPRSKPRSPSSPPARRTSCSYRQAPAATSDSRRNSHARSPGTGTTKTQTPTSYSTNGVRQRRR